ncbi:MAG: rhodanese-like domain-containing protein [Candidatus Symbiobacter sp.]|nr:rhodanese-like domain-containing protein [Candidatus Symbiobacter sp.]
MTNLISCLALHEQLETAPHRVKLVDATWFLPNDGRNGFDEYQKAHIAGAVFFDLDQICDRQTALPHMLPRAEDFAAEMQRLGIGHDDKIVCYDAHGLMTAARLWWMLRGFGYRQALVLDGGLPQWRRQGFAVVSGGESLPGLKTGAGTGAQPFAADLVCSRDQIKHILDDGRAVQLIDARPRDRFLGLAPEPRPGLRPGHIPGAKNLPFGDILAADKTVLPLNLLREKFILAGIDPRLPVIASCGSGVTACVLALGLSELGNRQVAVYDGSWAEWGQDASLPVATAP